MIVEIEKKSGFCFGVKRVVKMAEQLLDRGEVLYCLGQLVHNEIELQRLTERGLVIINHEQLAGMKNVKILIRAHGEPPETYRIARENNIELIDGTCPIVQSLQRRIKKDYHEIESKKGQIILYGKSGHPEISGLNGQINEKALIISRPEKIFDKELSSNVRVFSQTTMDSEGFEKLTKLIKKKLSNREDNELRINNTICRHISHREPGIRKFAGEYQIVIFVSGKNSSNGKLLYDICKSENENSYFVSGPEELKAKWFEGIHSVGICGATSTPGWLLKKVASVIRNFT